MAKKVAPTTTDKSEAPKCPVTKAQFLAHAKPLMVIIDGKQMVASVKEFATGSFGFYAGDKTIIMIDGVPVKVQIGLNMTVIGSKEAK